MSVYKVKPFLGDGGSGGSGSSYMISIYCTTFDYPSSPCSITLNVDDNTLGTYNELVDYLISKNCTVESGWENEYNLYPCVGLVNGEGVVAGICVGYAPDQEMPTDLDTLYVNLNGSLCAIDTNGFEIIYPGQN